MFFLPSFCQSSKNQVMKNNFLKSGFLLAFVSLSLLATAFTVPIKFGLDSYYVYLNDRLILSQPVNKPLSMESLQLGRSNASDKLVIFYSQCNVDNKLGKSRSLALKDSNG